MVEATVADREGIWYATDDGILFSGFAERYNRHPLFTQYPFQIAVAGTAWPSLVGPPPRVKLLPAKRRLKTTDSLNFSLAPDPAGSGIVNTLSFSLNQDKYSDERQFYNNVVGAFSALSDGHAVEITPDRQNFLHLRFTLPDSLSRPRGVTLNADDCGLGLQDLLLIVYFALDPSIDVLCIEEPESHLHPDLQRRLLGFLRSRTDKQYVLTTHSSVCLDIAHVDRVFLCTSDAEIVVNDETSRAKVLTDLGYSVADNLVADLLLLVEGPSDKAALEAFLAKMQLPERCLIKMWPLCGDAMLQLDLTVVVENRNVIALIDGDPESDKVRLEFMEQCNKAGIYAHRLQRRALENYFSMSALRRVLGSRIQSQIDRLDPDTLVERQIGCNPKRRNRDIVSAMTLDDIAGTDLHQFLLNIQERLVSLPH